jgi:hypothetical protein
MAMVVGLPGPMISVALSAQSEPPRIDNTVEQKLAAGQQVVGD